MGYFKDLLYYGSHAQTTEILRQNRVGISEDTPKATIFRYYRPLDWICVVLGLRSPFRRVSLLFCIYCVFLIVAMSITSIYNIIDTVEEFYDSFEAFLIFIFTHAFVLLAATKAPQLKEIVYYIHRVDIAFQAIQIHYRYSLRLMLRTLLARLTVVLIICSLDAYSYSIIPWTTDGVANIFSYYYFYVLFDIIQMQYITTVLSVGHHFALVNEKISKDLLSSSKSLCQVLFLHDDLCKTSQLIQDYFSEQLFIISSFVFCNNTSHAYCLLSTLSSVAAGAPPAANEEDNGPRWFIFGLRYVFIIFRMIELSWVVNATTYLETQAHKSCDVISELLVLDKQSTKNEVLDLHLSMRQEVDIWACGCFKMDKGLILTMLSAATTYIMVLVQYAPEKQPEFIKGVHSTNTSPS